MANNFDFVQDCLRHCWLENPEERPDFQLIRARLRPLRKGMSVSAHTVLNQTSSPVTDISFCCRKPNILDNIMTVMEKYANNLEVLVDERTDQLEEEKRKTGL